MKLADLRKAKKKQLLAMLLKIIPQNRRLRAAVSRMTKLSTQPPVIRHISHEDDFVPTGWAEQHGIHIPRAEGIFESATAWVRITHGVITGAGLKNQSILSMMISVDLLEGNRATHYANVYVDWRAAFFARIEAARYSNEGTGDPNAWSKEDRFSKLLHAVERDCLQIIDSIVKPRPKAKEIAGFHDDHELYVDSFKTLIRSINQINKDADDYLEKKNACA